MSSEKSLTPQIRFKGFTEAWEQRKLGDYGFVQMCRRIYKDQTSEIGDVPFFKIGTFGSQPDAFISRRLFQDYRKQYPFPSVGTPLISAAGSIGRTVIYQGEEAYFQDSNIVWLDNNVKLNNVFLNSLYKKIDWKLEGSTIKRLYNKDILNAEVCVPSTIEQCQVGSFFAHLDSLITLHQRKLNTLKKIKSALLEKMFPKDGSNVPEIRFTGFTEAWEQRKLGDIAEIIGGGTPDTNNPSYWDGDIDWYSPAELGEQIYTIGSRRRITKEGYKNSSAKLLPANKTILFTSRAGIGTTAILCRSACTNQGFQSLVINDNTDLYFIYSMSSRIKDFAISKASGSTFLEISGKQLATMNLFLPQLNEQKKIGQYFKSLDNLITLHQRKLDALKKIKSALLEKMFV